MWTNFGHFWLPFSFVAKWHYSSGPIWFFQVPPPPSLSTWFLNTPLEERLDVQVNAYIKSRSKVYDWTAKVLRSEAGPANYARFQGWSKMQTCLKFFVKVFHYQLMNETSSIYDFSDDVVNHGCSIWIPRDCAENKCGYLEDHSTVGWK